MRSRLFAATLAAGAAMVGAALIPSRAVLSAPSQKLPDLVPWTGSFNNHFVAHVSGRRVLRFNVGLLNIGTGALEIRGTRNNRNQPMMGFQRVFLTGGSHQDFGLGEVDWVPSEQEWHVMYLATYDLLDAGGNRATDTQKFSHCISDDSRKQSVPGAPSHRIYTACPGHARATSFKVGLSLGFADVYDAGTRNQWLDITNVSPGNYTVRIHVNPDGAIRESNPNNNVLTRSITL